MLIFGLDVGVKGCICCLRDDGAFLDLEDLPLVSYRSATWIDGIELAAIVRKWRGPDRVPAIAAVEHIHGMPKMTSVANNSKGLTLGSALSILQITGCKIELIPPQCWKRYHGLLMPKATDTEKKRASLRRARGLFPSAPLEQQSHHNRAEALLIGLYGLRDRQGQLAVA